VVLAHAEHLQPETVGQLDLLQQLSQALRDSAWVSTRIYVGERRQAQLHG
jgi:hypothetical protein